MKELKERKEILVENMYELVKHNVGFNILNYVYWQGNLENTHPAYLLGVDYKANYIKEMKMLNLDIETYKKIQMNFVELLKTKMSNTFFNFELDFITYAGQINKLRAVLDEYKDSDYVKEIYRILSEKYNTEITKYRDIRKVLNTNGVSIKITNNLKEIVFEGINRNELYTFSKCITLSSLFLFTNDDWCILSIDTDENCMNIISNTNDSPLYLFTRRLAVKYQNIFNNSLIDKWRVDVSGRETVLYTYNSNYIYGTEKYASLIDNYAVYEYDNMIDKVVKYEDTEWKLTEITKEDIEKCIDDIIEKINK